MQSTNTKITERQSEMKKIAVSLAVIVTYSLLNYFLRVHLPGVSEVDIRPQIILIFVIGYLYGPLYGFLAGFFGNLCTDFFLGFGSRYLISWTIGNGLIGVMTGLLPFRKCPKLDRIKQLVQLILFLILINFLALAYANVMEILRAGNISSNINFRYFFVPALLSNILGTLILFPLILLGLGRLKKNFPVKIALWNYYLTIILLIISFMILVPTLRSFPAQINSINLDITQGNAIVDAFNYWALLLVILLLIGFTFSSWMSKTVVTPLKQLEDTVFAVLKGDSSSADRLAHFGKREDEVGILSYTIRLLSEKLWETQKLFRDEMEKRLKFLDSNDSGSDIFIVALISIFGKEAFDNSPDGVNTGFSGELSNLAAISMLISICGLRELADTYSDAKVSKSYEDLDSNITEMVLKREARQALACAIDVNLIFKGRLKVIDIHAPLSRDFAFHLLEKVHAFRRSDKNYIGYVTEYDIISKMQEKWENVIRIRSARLEPVMNQAIAQKVITGYQIKNNDDLANFDADLKITYSHSNFKHIKQLIGLLISENLQAKLQLEPKRSSFLYLEEWEKTADLFLESLPEGVSVAHKDEFDLVMEFTEQKHRDYFRDVINAYAKREYQAEQKLLFESWYQPLYSSEVPVEGYFQIADIIIRDKSQIVQTYVKEAESAAITEWFGKEFSDLDIAVNKIWVNDAFFRYLEGDYD